MEVISLSMRTMYKSHLGMELISWNVYCVLSHLGMEQYMYCVLSHLGMEVIS